MKLKYSTLIHDMSSEAYHSVPNTVSSSKLKDLLDDPEIYHAKYVAEGAVRFHIPAFDTGSIFHTATLERHKLKDEVKVFPGAVRRGKVWEAFLKKNKGKIVVPKSQYNEAMGLAKLVKNSPVAQKYLKGAKAEVSLFIRLLVVGDDIYAMDHGLKITRDGWVKAKVPKKGTVVIAKVRSDALGKKYISDLKSTTSNSKSREAMKASISKYSYELSAAFYLDMFNVIGLGLKGFIWIFASKAPHNNTKTWKASKDNILIGRAKWTKAIVQLARCMENDWEFEDSLGILEPAYWEREHLEKSYTDIL